MVDFEIGQMIEQLSGQMRYAADAGGGIVERARFGFGEGNQFSDAFGRRRRVYRQQHVHRHQLGDGREIPCNIKRHFAVERLIDGEIACGADKHHMPVRIRLGGYVGADDAIGAAAIVHYDLLL